MPEQNKQSTPDMSWAEAQEVGKEHGVNTNCHCQHSDGTCQGSSDSNYPECRSQNTRGDPCVKGRLLPAVAAILSFYLRTNTMAWYSSFVSLSLPSLFIPEVRLSLEESLQSCSRAVITGCFLLSIRYLCCGFIAVFSKLV